MQRKHYDKRALLVGINHYQNPADNLKGCVNDVLMTSRYLQEQYGFLVEGIRVLTDERATTQNIRDRLKWLASDMIPGDTLVFHYSGHGSQVRDRDGDELKDHLDEIICPYDLNWDDPITDDELGKVFAEIPQDVSVTVLLDSCHSGTGLKVIEAVPRRSKFLVPPPDIFHRAGPQIVNEGINRSVTMCGIATKLELQPFGKSLTKQRAVLVAGCRADQLSSDAWIDGDYHGAFTYCFWASVETSGWTTTYKDAVKKTAELLRSNNYSQVPQLEGPGAHWKVFTPMSKAAAA